MIKRITLDTNNNFNIEANLRVVVTNEADQVETILTPTFTEILLGSLHTGIYNADIDLEPGTYTIVIEDTVSGKKGELRATIQEGFDYTGLSTSVGELENIIDGIDDSSSFR